MPSTNFEVGSRFEVEEGGVWYPVRVIQEEESRVWIHFEGWSQRYDRWLEKNLENVRGSRHTMKRRSRADDEKPVKRTSCTLKVGGVFHANSRRSRKSNEQQEAPQLPSPQQSIKGGASSNSKTSNKNKDIPKSENVAERIETKLKGSAPATTVQSTPQTTKVVPPVGWAYEVVKDPKDLLPKKAFQINEDHNEFKCSEANCSKAFRKENLLLSHLKHYHGVNLPEESAVSTIHQPSVTPESKRRRIGKRSKSELELITVSEEISDKPTVLETENSSSTDISNSTIIDNDEVVCSKDLTEDTSHINNLDSSKDESNDALHPSCSRETESVTNQDVANTSPEKTSQNSAALRAPLFGRVGQNRFVPIPETLVLGREKRKVVKTERMQEAQGSFLKKNQKGVEIPPERPVHPKTVNEKERRRKSEKPKESPEESKCEARNEEKHPVSEVHNEDDEDTICSSTTFSESISRKNAQETPEKDMVHCHCGVTEESGLMMQCDLCLCWQHGSCFGIENEQLVPEKYICLACQNARRVLHKRNHKIAAYRAMNEGCLTGLTPEEKETTRPFVNLLGVANVMANLKLALCGLETRILKIMNDKDDDIEEKRSRLQRAVEDTEKVQRQMDTCERILSAIDRSNGDQGNEAMILKSTVKSVMKDLATVRRLTLFK